MGLHRFGRVGELPNAHVFVTRVIPQPGIDLLRSQLDVEVNEPDTPLSTDQLRQQSIRCDGLVTLLTDRIDRDVMGAGERLKVVANVAVGYDNIDIPAATELGIVVTNTPGVLTDTTADFAFALVMAIGRRVVEGDSYLRAGRYTGWGIQLLMGGDIHGATLGLVGLGRIGQGMVERARGFNMRVLYFDEYRQTPEREKELGVQYVDLDTLLSESDFVSLHTPLTPETRHLMNKQRLGRMKSSAYLVNTSRGPCVDEAALAEALREGVIAGAALDVFEEEPDVHEDLLKAPNVILTPHIASASIATRTRMSTMAAENCIATLEGHKPSNPVNPEVFDTEAFRLRRQQKAGGVR